MKTNRRESSVKAAVEAYLNTRPDWYGWRANTGGAHLNGFFVRFNKRGVADFIGLQAVRIVIRPDGFPPSVFGRFVAVECKREEGGEQTADQKLFQQNVEAFGGLYILAEGVDDVARGLGAPTTRVVKHRKARVVPR